ncbi:MAG: response regulator, partial [Desulfofustis sp.]|nr:response regulator [Desulfofustis sp.]
MKILIIDDEPAIRDILRTWFEMEGLTVYEAGDGQEGVRIQKKTAVDMLVCDLIMPVQEGIETISYFRSSFPEVGIIAISGGGRLAPDQYLEIARQLGAWKIFRKPLDIKQILEAVRQWQ